MDDETRFQRPSGVGFALDRLELFFRHPRIVFQRHASTDLPSEKSRIVPMKVAIPPIR